MHALEMLEADCDVPGLRDDAQHIINELPPRKRLEEKSPQSIRVVIGEIQKQLRENK
jgi:hypothetical protein